MKYAALALVLVALAASASAANWSYVGKTNEGDSRFVDLNRITRQDPAQELVEAWHSTELSNPAGKVRSIVSLIRFDCKNRSFRIEGEASYSDRHLAGTLVSDSLGTTTQRPSEQVTPQSIDEVELNLVCDHSREQPHAQANDQAPTRVAEKADLVVTSIGLGKGCCDGDKNVLFPGHFFRTGDGPIVASVHMFARNIDKSESYTITLQWTYGPQHNPLLRSQWLLHTGPDGSELDKLVATGGWIPGSYFRTINSGKLVRWESGNYHLDVMANGQLLKSFDFDVQ